MHPLIKIAKKRQKKGCGSTLLPINPVTSCMLNTILTVPYALIGGQATKSYMPERNTLDWDIIIASENWEEAEIQLKNAQAHTFRPLTIHGFSCLLENNTPLDVILSDEDWINQALIEAKQDSPSETDPVLPLPWLILLKLQASRVQDLADISRMISRADKNTQASTRNIIQQYLPEAVEDLNSLVELGELEL